MPEHMQGGSGGVEEWFVLYRNTAELCTAGGVGLEKNKNKCAPFSTPVYDGARINLLNFVALDFFCGQPES